MEVSRTYSDALSHNEVNAYYLAHQTCVKHSNIENSLFIAFKIDYSHCASLGGKAPAVVHCLTV